MNMAVSAIQYMVVLQEAGSELRGYYLFFCGWEAFNFPFFSFLFFFFNLFFLISACLHEKSSLRYKEFDAVYALQFDWQRNYIVVKF